MDFYNAVINEVLMADVASRGWKDFDAKYGSLAGRRDLFVQFTDYAGNTDDKRFVGQSADLGDAPPKVDQYDPASDTVIGRYYPEGSGKKTGMVMSDLDKARIQPDLAIWERPSHKDPTAIYSYPLEYVINHPTSIPYGSQMRFLRVLKLRGGAKVLDLQTLDKPTAMDLLRKMGLDMLYVDEIPAGKDKLEYLWELGELHCKENYRGYAITAPKIFFVVAQAASITRYDGGFVRLNAASNNIQRRRFLQAGITVVMDTARNAGEAVIHCNEPEQCFFLDRGAFDILDVYEVSVKTDKNQYRPEIVDYKRAMPKIAARILSYIDDKDTITGLSQDLGGIQLFTHPLKASGEVNTGYQWVAKTKRGRMIGLDMIPKTVNSPVADEQPHRRGTKFLNQEYKVTVLSEFGTAEDKVAADEDLETAARRIGKMVRDSERNPKWKPISDRNNTAAKAWIEILRYTPDENALSEVNIDDLITKGNSFVSLMSELLDQIGFKWQRPSGTNSFDNIACWIVAWKLIRPMMQAEGLAYDYPKGSEVLKRRVHKILTEGFNSSPLKANELESLKGTPNYEAAKSIQAASLEPEFVGDKFFLHSLVNGIEFLFLKRWPAAMEGAFPNWSMNLHRRILDLIEATKPEEYTKRLKQIWKDINSDATPHPNGDKVFYDRTGTHPDPAWKTVQEVIIGNRYSLETPAQPRGGAMPTVWRDSGKEAPFSAPAKQSPGNDPRMASAKAAVQKIIKRHLTWIKDPSTGTETAYIGHGRKVRIGTRDLKTGPMTIALRADKMPSNLDGLLG